MRRSTKNRIAGAAGGLINGLFGGGGGTVLLPLLTGWGGLQAKKAFATCVAIILPMCCISAAVYLWQVRPELRVVLPYLATCTLIAWLSPLSGMNEINSLLLQLGSGYVLFAGVFLINDPVTTPRFWLGRLFYGILTAMMVMLLQRVGRFEAGTCFGILLMNAFAPIIDRWSWHSWYRLTHKRRTREEVTDE